MALFKRHEREIERWVTLARSFHRESIDMAIENAKLKGQIEDEIKTVNNARDLIMELNAKMDEQTRKIDSLSDQNASYQHALENARDLIQKKNNEIESSDEAIKNHVKQIVRLNTTIDGLKTLLNQVNEDVIAADDKVLFLTRFCLDFIAENGKSKKPIDVDKILKRIEEETGLSFKDDIVEYDEDEED